MICLFVKGCPIFLLVHELNPLVVWQMEYKLTYIVLTGKINNNEMKLYNILNHNNMNIMLFYLGI